MYAWKCWRETRASFIFLLIMSTAVALLITLAPGLKEQNGWWHFDRSEYLHNPWPTAQMVTIQILSSLGFRNVAITERFDPFGGTSKEATARKFGVIGVNVFAAKE